MILKSLTKKDIISLLEFVENVFDVDHKKKLQTLLNSLKIFIPFNFAICGLFKINENKQFDIIDTVNLSFPYEWMETYFKRKYVYVDPIIQRHISEFIPQIWSQTYKQYPCLNQDFICLSRDFKLVNGVTYGLKDKHNSIISIFSFSGILEKPSNRHLEFLKFLIPHLHQLLMRLAYEKDISKEKELPLKISPREKEVLDWLHKGKTNWETSMILNISERTVKFHVSNILDKLDAVSRGHAVAKAIEFGIIKI